MLGEGSYGRVYLAEWHATPCAVKLLLSDAPAGTSSGTPQPISSSVLGSLADEADVMLTLRCAALRCCNFAPSCITPTELQLCQGTKRQMAANPCQACGACPLTCAPPFSLRNLGTHRHPNCVSIMGVVTLPPCLVTEYCELGSLTSLLWAAREDPEKAAALT